MAIRTPGSIRCACSFHAILACIVQLCRRVVVPLQRAAPSMLTTCSQHTTSCRAWSLHTASCARAASHVQYEVRTRHCFLPCHPIVSCLQNLAVVPLRQHLINSSLAHLGLTAPTASRRLAEDVQRLAKASRVRSLDETRQRGSSFCVSPPCARDCGLLDCDIRECGNSLFATFKRKFAKTCPTQPRETRALLRVCVARVQPRVQLHGSAQQFSQQFSPLAERALSARVQPGLNL